MSAAAGALRDLARRQAGTTSSVVTAGVWKGPASEAFGAGSAGSGAGLERATASLDEAAGALAELAARLEHAQATWDRARRLAAVVGVELGPAGGAPAPGPGWGPGSGSGGSWGSGAGVVSPVTAVDPAASLVAGQALGIAEAAEQEAAAARRVAAARLDQAAAAIGSVAAGRGSGARAAAGASPRSAVGGPPAAGPGQGSAHGERHAGPVERAVNGALEVGAEVAMATHHLVWAAEARLAAAGRLAAMADHPAVRAAAGRVAETAGRPMLDGRIIFALPLAAPVLDLTAALRHGEPLPRALTGAVGSAVGADLGGRLGLAACGGEAAATQGAGLIVCPALTAVGGAVGAQVGRNAFLYVYDELTGPPGPDPAAEETVRPERAPRPGG